MRLVMIRHAESMRNRAMKGGRIFYRTEQEKLGVPTWQIDLTEQGELQAKNLGETIIQMIEKGEIKAPDYIQSSGLKRANKTAEIVLRELKKSPILGPNREHLEVSQNHLIRERESGYGYEMTTQESIHHFPYLQDHFRLEGRWFAAPPSGESLVRVMDRAELLLQKLTSDVRYQDKTVYAFSHGGFMMALTMVVKGIPFEEALTGVKNPENCEMHTYTDDGGYWERL